MVNIRGQLGVTLMELVVTLAILGVLAAIGTPVLMGNIRAAKNIEAQNTLKSIYLMQKNYFAENYCYYVNSGSTDSTSLINQYLSGSSTLNMEIFIATIWGLIIGSFLNVVIHRLPKVVKHDPDVSLHCLLWP
uniref:Uncharacterized protein n=1 Tax=Polynucleobacter necessarius subsp. necessarius (strain STIR1) TaxID=452638 RepID=B1XUC2_POLNS